MLEFHYSICNTTDEKIFYAQCEALEEHIPNMVKGDALVDVDGSLVQGYQKDGKEILVHNSYYIGAVFVDSDIELTQFFKT